ncbi:MAG: DUF2085 domain-containing protein [Deltaproteobacteria bacterium]|nr:DUF2085 domain-containing protein [Deltaproteobacteria bacterium]
MSGPTRRALRVTVVGRAALVLVGLAPWLVLVLAAALGPTLGEWLGLPFALVCHRRPERSLELFGVIMPVCSRCAGLYAGGALGALVGRPRLALPTARVVLALAAGLLVLDVVTQDAGMHPVWHATRFATGGALGYLAAATLVGLMGPVADPGTHAE